MGDLDLEAGTLRVVGKGQKERAVYLATSTFHALCQWLAVRERWAEPDTSRLFVAVDTRTGAPG